VAQETVNLHLVTEEAHVSRSAFDEIVRIASVHKLSVSAVLSAFVFCQLARRPSSKALEEDGETIFGPSLSPCIRALRLEGWLSPLENKKASPQNSPSSLDALASSWERLTGERLPHLFLKNLAQQAGSKYGPAPIRSPEKLVKMFRDLFPGGSFSSLVADVHRFSSTMDSAAQVWSAAPAPLASLEKWEKAWIIAKTTYPGSLTAEDPYLFVPAISSRFDVSEFRRLAGSLELRDALSMAAMPQCRLTAPNRASLTGIKETQRQ